MALGGSLDIRIALLLELEGDRGVGVPKQFLHHLDVLALRDVEGTSRYQTFEPLRGACETTCSGQDETSRDPFALHETGWKTGHGERS